MAGNNGKFKTITMSDHVHAEYKQRFKDLKPYLAKRGIKTLSGYITSLMEEAIQNTKHDESLCKYQIISISPYKVVLYDTILELQVSVSVRTGWMACSNCDFYAPGKCEHIGFCLSLHQVYPVYYGEKVE